MKKPDIHPSVFVAPGAVVRGDVQLAAGSSVFYNAVLRGDRAAISIGEGTNIQDNCVVHGEYDLPVTGGKNVTVGHGAILHGCTIGDETLIGMGAIVLNGAKIGKNCLIGAGALVTQNAVIPDGSMVIGSPAKVKRPLTEEEMASVRQSAADYVRDHVEYLFSPCVVGKLPVFQLCSFHKNCPPSTKMYFSTIISPKVHFKNRRRIKT